MIKRTLKNKPGVAKKIDTKVKNIKLAAQATLLESEEDLERSKQELKRLQNARTNTK